MTAEGVAPIARRAARIVLLDDQDRVLLLHGRDPARPAGAGDWWITPGGGVEPGESLIEAARRELREETGIEEAEPGPAIWFRATDFSFEGRRYLQHEWFHVVRAPTGTTIDTGGFTDVEQRSLDGHRWWSVDELQATVDTIYPLDLAVRLEALLRDGPPDELIELTG
jgi:8-oxo-dGTP pyrophosphatase MutT (NUDIX family)